MTHKSKYSYKDSEKVPIQKKYKKYKKSKGNETKIHPKHSETKEKKKRQAKLRQAIKGSKKKI